MEWSGIRLRYLYYDVVVGFFHLNKGQKTEGYKADDENIMVLHLDIKMEKPVCADNVLIRSQVSPWSACPLITH